MNNKTILFLMIAMVLVSGCNDNAHVIIDNQQACHKEMDKEECEINGGIWHPPGAVCLSMSCPKANPPYCECPTNILFPNEDNRVDVGTEIILTNVSMRDKRENEIRIFLDAMEQTGYGWEYDFFDISYDDMDKNPDETYSVKLTAPKIPGKYKLILEEIEDRRGIRTTFNLTVMGDVTTRDMALKIADREFYSAIDREDESISTWSITIEEADLFENKWYVDMVVDYDFGCCSTCPPNTLCTEQCASCGIKTIKGFFVINKTNGIIEHKSIEEIACKESTGAWDGPRELVGDDCEDETDEPGIGGPCYYETFRGICKITSINKTEESIHQAKAQGSAGYEGFEIIFDFKSKEDIPIDGKDKIEQYEYNYFSYLILGIQALNS